MRKTPSQKHPIKKSVGADFFIHLTTASCDQSRFAWSGSHESAHS